MLCITATDALISHPIRLGCHSLTGLALCMQTTLSQLSDVSLRILRAIAHTWGCCIYMLRKRFGIYIKQSMCFRSALSDADHITDLTAVEAVFLGQKKSQNTLAREQNCADAQLVTAHIKARRVPRNSFWKRCPDPVELPPRRDGCWTKWLTLLSSDINSNGEMYNYDQYAIW